MIDECLLPRDPDPRAERRKWASSGHSLAPKQCPDVVMTAALRPVLRLIVDKANDTNPFRNLFAGNGALSIRSDEENRSFPTTSPSIESVI